MDRTKIDEAVKVMQALSPEERAIVNYTVDRESGRRKRRAKAENGAATTDDTQGVHPT